MPVNEPTYNTGPDTHDQSNPAQPGADENLHDAVKAKDDLNSAAGYGQKAAGEATQQEPPFTSTETKTGPFGTPESNPSAATLNGPLEQAHNDASKIFDNSAPRIAPPQMVAPPTPTASPAPGEAPLVIPDSMRGQPDVVELTNAQQQLQQVQATAAQAEADYKAAGPNANMAPMLKAQAQLKGQQVFVKMLTEKVKAKLPRLPIGTGATNKGPAGTGGSQNQPTKGP
jgi:hypothetical protein